MKILYITTGTGGFYCGTCLRDQALAYGLRSMGHEVHLLPLYVPMTLEHDDADDCPLFMGAVNVWLQNKMSLFRHTPRFIDKLFDSAKLLRFAGKKSAMIDVKGMGQMTVSSLQGIDGTQHKEIKRMLKWLKTNVQPDVICYSNLLLTGLHKALASVYHVPQIACMQGEEIFLDALSDPYREQAWELLRENSAQLSRCIGVSHYHTRLMEQRLALPSDAYRCVYNGIRLQGFSVVDPPKTPRVGFLSRMCAAKGLHIVIDAFIAYVKKYADETIELLVVGSCTQADEAFLEQQVQKLRTAGLLERVCFEKNVSRDKKIAAIQKMSLMSVPCTYGEAFGLYILKSLACAVPLILPNRGSFHELVNECNGGIIYEVDDLGLEAKTLADSWRLALDDRTALRKMGEDGRDHVYDRFDEISMATGFYACIEDVHRAQQENG